MGNEFRPSYSDDWDAIEDTKPLGDAPSAREPTSTRPERSIQAANIPNRASSSVVRAVPHKRHPNNFPGFIARSAMFRASNSSECFPQPTTVRAQGCLLTLSGPKLGMRDKHVWETAIQIAKERASNIGDAFEIELRDLARRMGSTNYSGRALTSLWESLERLALCRVEFEIGASCKGIGSLLATAFRDEGRLYLRLNPDFAIPALLGDKQFLFDQGRRRALPLALSQWLHDFYSTHKQSRDIDLAYLRKLCGYEGCPRNFPSKLRTAMKALVEAAPSLVESFEIVETGRSSDAWKLRVVLGSEKPSFLQPERIAADPKTGRGRVAL